MSSCSVPGCVRLAKVRGWCSSHYQRWYTHGDPEGGRTERGALPRFIDEAIAYKGDDHLLWPFGSSDKDYYPVILIDGKNQQVNRLICERVNGAPPSDIHQAAHSCGINRCCNPRHIYWATPKENMDDTIEHGTRPLMSREGTKHTDESKERIAAASKARWKDKDYLEKMQKRKSPKGEEHGGSKLTKEDVFAIRALNGKLSQNELAKQFNVDQSRISDILNWKSWK